MITDRSRLGPDWKTRLIERSRIVARAGGQLIQVRERGLEGRDLLDLVRRIVGAVSSTSARVVVNDRLDVALLAGAGGVHLRGDSMPAWRVREVAPPGFLVGRSVHSLDEARAVEGGGGVDYLVFGHVYETSSKLGVAAVGEQQLEAVARAVAIPVIAVGGMTVERARAVARCGARGMAAIGLFADTPIEALPDVVRASILAFDDGGRRS